MQYFDKSAVAQHALENNLILVSMRPDLLTRATNYWDRIRQRRGINGSAGSGASLEFYKEK